MKAIRTSNEDMLETPCPACGTAISTASIGRRRRVQCPRCREVVELKPAEKSAPKLAALPPAAVENVSVPVSKIAALEARIAALEAAAKASAPVQPIEVVVQRPARKWKWLGHSASHEGEHLPTNVAEVFLQNLGNYDGQTIAIQIASGDKRALARATSLKEVFDRAQWTVFGPGEVIPRNAETGLFLAVGSLPLPPAARSDAAGQDGGQSVQNRASASSVNERPRGSATRGSHELPAPVLLS